MGKLKVFAPVQGPCGHQPGTTSRSEQPREARRVILTPKGVAELLDLDDKTVTRWARQGYIPAHPLGEGKRKVWRFFESELVEWLAAQTNQLEAA